MVNWLRKTYWNAFTLWHARNEAGLPYRRLEETLALQNRRVRAMVTHAYKTVPYYRAIMSQRGLRPGDFRTAEDLARLPILTSKHVARTPEQFLSHRYANTHGVVLHSSGTSGFNKLIHYDSAALFLALAHGHRQRIVLAHFTGRRFGYRELVINRSDSVGVRLRNFYESFSWIPQRIDFTRDCLLPGNSSLADDVAQLSAFQPDVIRGYGSYIGSIFRWAWTHGLTIFRPKVVVYGADHMPEADRLLIEKEFGVPVISSYQAAEALRIAFQCERRQGFHINLDHIAVRVVDKEGELVTPGGTGEIVISNLTNRATVLLNYKLGDVVTLGNAPCPCGRTLPTIERIEGRSDDLIVLPDGRLLLSLVVLQELQVVSGLVQIQVVQEDFRRFVLRIVYAGDTDWAQVRQRLDTAMRALCGNDITLAIEQVETISPEPGGKVRAVISRCR